MSNPQPTVDPQPEVETGRSGDGRRAITKPACWGTHPLGTVVPPLDPCWDWLRREFPPHAKGKLVKYAKSDRNAPECPTCGARHTGGANALHVDYIGHAFLRERLNEVEWSYELDRTPDAGPMVVQEPDGKLVWIPFRMTVMGAVKEEVAVAELSKDEWPKVLWSDVITRGAMAHGIGLHLWQKDMPTDREPSTTGQGQGSSGGRGQRQPTAAERRRAEETGARLAEARAIVQTLEGADLAEWEAWKAEHEFDATSTTLEAASDALAWLRWFTTDPTDTAGVDDDTPAADQPATD